MASGQAVPSPSSHPDRGMGNPGRKASPGRAGLGTDEAAAVNAAFRPAKYPYLVDCYADTQEHGVPMSQPAEPKPSSLPLLLRWFLAVWLAIGIAWALPVLMAFGAHHAGMGAVA